MSAGERIAGAPSPGGCARCPAGATIWVPTGSWTTPRSPSAGTPATCSSAAPTRPKLTRQAPERIAHTHLKDVDATVAAMVQAGRLTYTEAVRQGMYRPLGTGDVDVQAIVGHLRANGYDGWYTLEQDTILTDEPSGDGLVADVWASAEHLRGILAGTG